MPRSIVLFGLLFMVACGCGEDKFGMPNAVTLNGTLSDGGEPLFVEGIENATGMIVLEFHPMMEDGQPQPTAATTATVDLEGNFEIPQGIEPGEYTITVRQWQPYPQNDLLKGRFRLGKSKIVRSIAADTSLDIDISNPTGE